MAVAKSEKETWLKYTIHHFAKLVFLGSISSVKLIAVKKLQDFFCLKLSRVSDNISAVYYACVSPLIKIIRHSLAKFNKLLCPLLELSVLHKACSNKCACNRSAYLLLIWRSRRLNSDK